MRDLCTEISILVIAKSDTWEISELPTSAENNSFGLECQLFNLGGAWEHFSVDIVGSETSQDQV